MGVAAGLLGMAGGFFGSSYWIAADRLGKELPWETILNVSLFFMVVVSVLLIGMLIWSSPKRESEKN